MAKQKKILVGPCEVAGYYRNLCEGFRQLGIPYDFITYEPHPFGYGGETRQPALLRMARWFSRFHEKPDRSWVTRVFGAWPAEILVSIWALGAIFRYQVFIFGFGTSLLRDNLDLPILRKLGKTVISNLGHGSEVRPPFINGFSQSQKGEPSPVDLIYALSRQNKQCMINNQKYCNIVIGAPYSTTHFASDRLINIFNLGIPFQPDQIFDYKSSLPNLLEDESEARAVRILHSPSNMTGKGSQQIIDAIDRLKQRGYAIDFILIHGRPFKEVIEEIQHCDFVVDQLYSDTPMAGFPTESAWFGKPAVVGGYGLDRLRSYVPEDMWPPSKTCHPDRIEQAIEELIVDVDQRNRLGREAQKFVQEKWNSVAVARRYLRLIDGDIPDEWWIDPEDVAYLEGIGLPPIQSQQMIRSLVEKYGVEALQLAHRPSLQKAFLEFAGIQDSH